MLDGSGASGIAAHVRTEALWVGTSPGGRGLTLAVAPEWGRSASGAQALWSARDARGLVPGGEFEAGRRLGAELGYGLGHGGGVLTPYAGMDLGDGGRRWRLGARWRLGEAAALGLEATRDATGEAGREHALTVRGALRF